MNAQTLSALLSDCPFVTEVHAEDELGSTNDELRALAARGAPEGTVVTAEAQTAGRGRRGRAWHSPRRLGLYVSVLIRPDEPLEAPGRWTLAGAVAACEACRQVTGQPVVVKWPNDLLLAGRKAGGLLAEVKSSAADARPDLVLGLGLNVHHAPEDFPPQLRASATSLRCARGEELEPGVREALAAAWLSRLGGFVRDIRSGGWSDVGERFLTLAPDARGRRVRITGLGGGNAGFTGETVGLDPSGALLVRREGGFVERVLLGRIGFPFGGLIMLLAVDVGNTHTVLGMFAGETLRAHWRLSTRRDATADEIGVQLRALMDGAGFARPVVDGMIVASVVPDVNEALSVAGQRLFDGTPLFVGPGVTTGMPIRCDNPHEVGADRIVNAVAAQARYGAPVVVADFGTATTFDVVGPGGDYLGGAIAPGLGISAEALFERAARLHRVSVRRPQRVIGRHTEQSLQSGLYYGYAGLVEGLIRRILAELGAAAPVVATGGLSSILAPELGCLNAVVPELTLEGLRIVWSRQGR